MSHWLLKTEPGTYSLDDLERERQAVWDGVRNNQALQSLRQMQKGDLAFIYHTGDDKSIVGVAEVTREAYRDPKEKDEKLVVVDLKFKRRLENPVSLAEIKADKRFVSLPLVRMPRLSVMPIPDSLWDALCAMGGLPKT